MDNKGTYQDKKPDRARLTENADYWELVEWHATPSPLRQPKTLGEWAEKHFVHQTTVSVWKTVDGWHEDVRARIKKIFKDDLPNVIGALRNRIYREGDPASIKLFLQWVDEWTPEESQKIKHEGEVKTSLGKQEITEIAKRVSEEIKKSYDE